MDIGQFNTAYIEIPKKQGKSELAAAVALLLTCGDFEEGAQVYGCAADRNQAKIVFNVAKKMVELNKYLKKQLRFLNQKTESNTKRIVFIRFFLQKLTQSMDSIYMVLCLMNFMLNQTENIRCYDKGFW